MVEKSKSGGDKEFITSFEVEKSKISNKVLKKRNLTELTVSDPDSIVGPDLKKKPKFDFDEIILDNLPKGELYERSLMHRDIINHSTTKFLINIFFYILRKFLLPRSPILSSPSVWMAI